MWPLNKGFWRDWPAEKSRQFFCQSRDSDRQKQGILLPTNSQLQLSISALMLILLQRYCEYCAVRSADTNAVF